MWTRRRSRSAHPSRRKPNSADNNRHIENQILPLLPHNVFLVVDNASVHDEVAICRILSRKNITLVKLPAYSYDLNPIEMVFAQVKAIACFSPGALSQNPMLAIVSAFEQVQPLNVRKFLSRVLVRFITDASLTEVHSPEGHFNVNSFNFNIM